MNTVVFKLLRRNGDQIRSGPGPLALAPSKRLSMTVYLYKEVREEQVQLHSDRYWARNYYMLWVA